MQTITHKNYTLQFEGIPENVLRIVLDDVYGLVNLSKDKILSKAEHICYSKLKGANRPLTVYIKGGDILSTKAGEPVSEALIGDKPSCVVGTYRRGATPHEILHDVLHVLGRE